MFIQDWDNSVYGCELLLSGNGHLLITRLWTYLYQVISLGECSPHIQRIYNIVVTCFFFWHICTKLLHWVNVHPTFTKFIIWAASSKKDPWWSCDVIEKWRHILAVKKLTCVCFKMFSCLQRFWRNAKTSEPCKIPELPPDSHCAINMLLKYKITEVKICVSLCKHHDVTFAKNDAAAESLFWHLFYYKFHKLILK